MPDVGYVDVEFANTYVGQHFVSTDELRKAWESLDDADKEVLLLRSFEAIETLPYTSRKWDATQETAFPRWPSQEIPSAVKCAQVENAVSMADSSVQEDAEFYSRMRQFGVTSYSIGNLSESIGDSNTTISNTQSCVSAKTYQMLKPYISGGYNIRGSRV
jgi:hypothetical protein